MDHKLVAETILKQLGGNKFRVMTGAKNFMSHAPVAGSKGPALSFTLPSRFAKDGINFVKIVLTAADTYDITFTKIGPQPSMKRLLQGAQQSITVVAEVTDIYADQLQSTFTRHTGLDTHL